MDAALQEISTIYEQNALDFNGLEKPYLLSLHRSHFLLDLIHQVRSHLAGELTLQRSLDGHTKDRLES